MKMLMIVFRESLEQDVMKHLRELGVRAFTELPSVVGSGEAGPAFHTFASPQANSIVLTALTDDQAENVINGLRIYRDQLAQRQHGAYIPLRVFTLPCDQVV
jgi:hypothetical protein